MKLPLRIFLFAGAVFLTLYSFYAAFFSLYIPFVVPALLSAAAGLLLLALLAPLLEKKNALKTAARGNFEALDTLFSQTTDKFKKLAWIDHYFRLKRPDKAEAFFKRHPALFSLYRETGRKKPERRPNLLERAVYLNDVTAVLYHAQQVLAQAPVASEHFTRAVIFKYEFLLTSQHLKEAAVFKDYLKTKTALLPPGLLLYTEARLACEQTLFNEALPPLLEARKKKVVSTLLHLQIYRYIIYCYGEIGKLAAMRTTMTACRLFIKQNKLEHSYYVEKVNSELEIYQRRVLQNRPQEER